MAVTALSSATRLDTGTNVFLYTWLAIPNGNTGAPISIGDYSDLTVTIEGTFSTGGSCTLKGSNNGTGYYALHDTGGTAITKTAAGISAVLETPRYIQPEVTAGDGSTSIEVRILARRGSR